MLVQMVDSLVAEVVVNSMEQLDGSAVVSGPCSQHPRRARKPG